MSTKRRITLISAAALAAIVAYGTGTGVAAAQRPTTAIFATSSNSQGSNFAAPQNAANVAQVIASANKVALVLPLRNEGVISLVIRTCGTSKNWQSVAADNGIKPPNYTVLYQVPVKVNCSSTTAPTKIVATATTSTSNGWVHPLPGTCRPSTGGGQFGAPRDGGARSHQGADLGGIEHKAVGTSIKAAAAGTVFVSGWVSGNAGYGVEIRHANGVVTKYFHMTKTAVGNGTKVSAGQTIGYMGATGDATGPHLHFEVWVNGKVWNPVTWLKQQGVYIGC